MNPTLVFVHGAFSSPTAFNYFRVSLHDYPQLSFTYNWDEPPSKTGKELATFVRTTAQGPVILLGHSLGGNVALHSIPHLIDTVQLNHVITYSSPFGGSDHAFLLGMLSKAPIFSHLRPSSPEIKSLSKIARLALVNVTSFVTTRGPLSAMNDGVVTVASQKALQGPNYIEVVTNHMEVLLSDLVVASTRQIIQS